MKQEHNKLYVISICVTLVLATIIAYEPVRHNGFVNYDDDVYVTNNPNVNGGITLNSVIWAFTKSYAENWHPITWLSHMLDCEIYGPNPLGHHITSVLIHIATTLLLFLLLSRITGAIWPSTFAAAVFALHPVHVESVAWIAERKDVLSGFFWMLTILAYARYARQPTIKKYLFVVLAFALGLMSKPMVVTLPFVLLLLDWWPLGRLAGFGNDTTAVAKKQKKKLATYPKVTLRHLVVEKVPLFVLLVFSSVVTWVAQQRGGVVIALEDAPLDCRIANMLFSYIKYIGKTIWPSRLAVFYPHVSVNLSDAKVIICALLLVLITALSIYVHRRRKYAAVGWLWYVGTLVPVIGLVQVGSQAMADRYMYIPMIGLTIVLGWAVKDLVDNRPRWRVVAAISAVVLLSFAVVLTRMQVRYWQNNATLFEHTLKVTKNNMPAENNYGMVLLGEGQYEEAIKHFNNILRINKSYARAYLNLGVAYSRLGRNKEAIQNFTRAIELEPNNAKALHNLAWMLATTDKASVEDINQAVKYAERACELTEYKNIVFLDTLAVTYAVAGRFEDAVKATERAINNAKAEGKKEMAEEMQRKLESYKADQLHHEK
ncbi:MAG: tetratricopeptide repeat protein [Phycisphaerae bacterium]|jgi:Tfp pilus assembly protein PilF